jgi:hypothetical protein
MRSARRTVSSTLLLAISISLPFFAGCNGGLYGGSVPTIQPFSINWPVAIGDLNGDGKPDLVVANFGNLDFSGSSVSVLLQDPSLPGQFKAATNYPGPNGVNAVTIGDMNGDGKLDLVIADGRAVTIRFQDPAHPGAFLAETTVTQ